jgi:zinc transport system substrate-binding protein
MTKKLLTLLVILTIFSCKGNRSVSEQSIITVSIPPFRYFVEKIAGQDFAVNIMVPPGANPHVYEPVPAQIDKLSRSKAYISNGFLGFEQTWLDRFYEINKTMVRLSLGDYIDPIISENVHKGDHAEGADPHYWVSPRCAMKMAFSVKELLCNLNPEARISYESNYDSLMVRIEEADRLATDLFSQYQGSSFMIYHPNLAYLARDYGITEIPVEFEGKEPPPSHLRELIDLAKEKNITTIFVQKEYDIKNAKAIASEIGAVVKVIDPLSPEWFDSITGLIRALHKSIAESKKTALNDGTAF